MSGLPLRPEPPERLMFPEIPPEEGFRLLGSRTLDGYAETLFGRALLATMRLLGPRRLIARLPKDIRVSDNCSNMETALLRACGAREPEVTHVSTKGRETIFRIAWRE